MLLTRTDMVWTIFTFSERVYLSCIVTYSLQFYLYHSVPFRTSSTIDTFPSSWQLIFYLSIAQRMNIQSVIPKRNVNSILFYWSSHGKRFLVLFFANSYHMCESFSGAVMMLSFYFRYADNLFFLLYLYMQNSMGYAWRSIAVRTY